MQSWPSGRSADTKPLMCVDGKGQCLFPKTHTYNFRYLADICSVFINAFNDFFCFYLISDDYFYEIIWLLIDESVRAKLRNDVNKVNLMFGRFP